MKRSEEGRWCPARLCLLPSQVSPWATPRAGSSLRDPVWGMRGGGQPGQLSSLAGFSLTSLLASISDYVIDDKVAVLQKRDHEGFGFVLRGAKGNEGGAA